MGALLVSVLEGVGPTGGKACSDVLPWGSDAGFGHTRDLVAESPDGLPRTPHRPGDKLQQTTAGLQDHARAAHVNPHQQTPGPTILPSADGLP